MSLNNYADVPQIIIAKLLYLFGVKNHPPILRNNYHFQLL